MKDSMNTILNMENLPGIKRNFEENNFVFDRHDVISDKIYLVRSGKVEVYQAKEGRKFILHTAETGDAFGYINLPENNRSNGYLAKVIEPSTIQVVPKKDFESFLEEKPKATREVLEYLGAQLVASQERLQDLALANTHIRVLNELLRQGVSKGSMTEGGCLEFKKEFTHEHLAQRLGLTRETVTRTLNSLKEEEVIFLHKNKLAIDCNKV